MKVLVKEDVIYIKYHSRARLNLPGEAGPFPKYFTIMIIYPRL